MSDLHPPITFERPNCARCQATMMLKRSSPGPVGFEHRLFECPKCNNVEKVVVASDPFTSGAIAWLAGELGHNPITHYRERETHPASGKVAKVEHKGIPYQVVQTASPTGFRWTVQLDENRTKTGTSSSKGNAIFQAVCVIDKVILASTKTQTASPSAQNSGDMVHDRLGDRR